MKTIRFQRARHVRKAVVLAVSAACAGSAFALEFETDGGMRGSVNTTVAAASSWRAEDPNQGIQQDRGQTYNWLKGEQFSEIYKINSELLLSKGDSGVVIRAKAWYDNNLNNRKVRYGNLANGFNGTTAALATAAANQAVATGTVAENAARAVARSGAPMELSDAGQPLLSRYDGIALLDAYVYTSFDVADNNLQLRLGRQVVNWGESVFFQGVNVATPVDVKALRTAGTEIKEALLPVESLYGNMGLPGGMSLEGFYQLKWRPSNLNSCDGDIWAIEMMGIGTSGEAGRCPLATNPSGSNAQAGLLALRDGASPTTFQAADLTAVPVIASKAPKNGGQWGVALRFPVEAIDTEFGLYAMNIHSRTPVLSGLVSSNYANIAKLTAQWEYPEDINVFGASAATTINGWSVAAELNHTPKLPVMLSGADLLNAGFVPGGAAMLGATGCVAKITTAFASTPGSPYLGKPAAAQGPATLVCAGILPPSSLGGLAALTTQPLAVAEATRAGAAGVAAGPLGDEWLKAYNASKAAGGAPIPYQGYRLKAKTNLQFNALNSLPKAITEAIGAQSGLFITEVMLSKADIDKLPSDALLSQAGTSPERFGRAFTFGGAGLGATKCSLVTASTPDNVRWGCANEGYMTPFSWGYRIRVSADYPQIFGTSWQMTPSIFFGHDVKGTSVDNQLLEDRKTVVLGLQFDLNKEHKINLNYTTFSNDANYNVTAHHDNYSVAYSYTF